MTTLQDFRFTPEVYWPKITHRPGRKQTQITRDTFEENYKQEQQRLDRRFAKYRVHSDEQFHHNRPLERGNTFWDNWKIVDRGRGKVEAAQEYTPLNPILNTLDTTPPPTSSRRAYLESSEGRRNPVMAPWREPTAGSPDPLISNECSVIAYSETSSGRNGTEQGNYDPIKSDWITDPENEKRRDEAGFTVLKGRRHLTGRDGGYQERQLEYLFTRRGKKRIPLPAEQGVYDPIKNAWLVLPQNKRICEGRSFAPVTKLQFR